MQDAHRIVDIYGREYLLRQLAEECAELAQAALKRIRASRGETPVAEGEAAEAFAEEMADVRVMAGVTVRTMGETFRRKVEKLADDKEARMAARLLDGAHGEGGTA